MGVEDQSQGLHGPLHKVEDLEELVGGEVKEEVGGGVEEEAQAHNENMAEEVGGLRVSHIVIVRVLLVRPATLSSCAYICILRMY